MTASTEPSSITNEAVPAGVTPAERAGARRTAAVEPAKRTLALVAVLIALLVIGAITRPDIFLDGSNFWSNELTVLSLASAIGVVTIGMTFVMIGGGIDLSVGALLALASVWCTTVATQSHGATGVIFAALAVGTGAGIVNGLLIAYGRLVPFIATLAMMVAARGLAQKISGSRTQINGVSFVNDLASNKILGVPYIVLIFAVVVALGWILLNRTTFGRRTVAVGGNAEAARLAGINIKRHTLLLYALSGLCCGIAALVVVAQTTSGSNTNGDLYELNAIAAAIIGGTALTGGRGTIVGSLFGVLIFSQIANLFTVNNLPTETQRIVNGAIIVGAVLIQQFRVTDLRALPQTLSQTLARVRSSKHQT